MIQEGAWRFSELVIPPLGKVELAAQLDAPTHRHADWRAYDAVYGTGPPLRVARARLCGAGNATWDDSDKAERPQ
jgi:hypothetical protein